MTGLQIVYAPELRRDARWSRIHDALMTALVQEDAGDMPPDDKNWRVVDTLDATEPAAPVLYVQLPERLRMPSGAQRSSSAWHEPSRHHARKPLAGLPHALAVRELESERDRDKEAMPCSNSGFDPYTTLKLKLHDDGWAAWRPIQGLNLTMDMVDALGEEQGDRSLPPLLDHKLRETLHELRVKQGLAAKRPFNVVGCAEDGCEDAPLDEGRASTQLVCLKAQSPRGAPARAVVMVFRWQQGRLHIDDVAMAAFRLPREQRAAGSRGMKLADIRRRQMTEAYQRALDSLEGGGCEPLREHIDALVASGLLASGQTLLYSVADDTLLREEQAIFGKRELLGATWRDFPFESLLTDGCLGPGHEGLNMGRAGAAGKISVAQQLISNVREDLYLQPEGRVVWGMRALIGTKQSVVHNNRLLAWRVQGRDPEAPDRFLDLANPHLTSVFKAYTETLTRDVLKAGQVSRMSLPGKLVSTLLRN